MAQDAAQRTLALDVWLCADRAAAGWDVGLCVWRVSGFMVADLSCAGADQRCGWSHHTCAPARPEIPVRTGVDMWDYAAHEDPLSGKPHARHRTRIQLDRELLHSSNSWERIRLLADAQHSVLSNEVW